MKYADVRPQIKSGDLLSFSHRVSPFRSAYDFKVWCVRFFQVSEYSHVGIACVTDGRVWVLESVTPIPRAVLLSESLPAYHTGVDLNWTPEVEAYARSFIGNPEYRYSTLEAVKAFFGLNSKKNKRIQCAEFVQMVYDKAGLFLKGKATPSEVTREVQALGGLMSLELEEQK